MASGTLPDRMEIKPKRTHAVESIFISLVFVIGGFIFIFTRQVVLIAIGMLSILYFGFTALSAAIKAFRRNSTLALSTNGIELYKDFGTVLIRWKNIEDIGSCSGYGSIVGIKLKSYDEYLAYIPSDQVDRLIGKQKVLSMLMFITSLYASRIPGLRDQQKSLRAYKDIQNMGDVLCWNRERYGYDITLSTIELDRSPDRFLRLIEKYLRIYGDAFVPDEE